MVKLNKIYTRTGDDGTTGLVDGSRCPKHSARINAMGLVVCTAVMLCTFVGVSLLRWPLIGVLLGIGSLACAWAYLQLSRQAAGKEVQS